MNTSQVSGVKELHPLSDGGPNGTAFTPCWISMGLFGWGSWALDRGCVRWYQLPALFICRALGAFTCQFVRVRTRACW